MSNAKTTETVIWDGVRRDIPKKDRNKFRQVFLYLIKKLADRNEVGRTSMHKLLYFVDFDYYELYEEQFMGLNYIKNTHGPTAPMFNKRWIDEMVNAGLMVERDCVYGGYSQKRYLPTTDTKFVLSKKDKQHIDSVIACLDERTGSDLSATNLENLSHKDIPWAAALPRQEIEYEAVFYRNSDTSVREYDEDDTAD